MRIAILASGKGSNLESIASHAAAGRLEAEPVLALSNNPGAEALNLARAHGIPVWCKAHQGLSRTDFDGEMLCALRAARAEAVILAGYMRILSAPFIREFAGRILNIHPAILPSFAGARGGPDALEHQVRLTGCTVHFVDESLDAGPIVIQAAAPLAAADALEDVMARVQALERRVYPQAIQWLARGRLKIEGRGVRLLPGPDASPRLASHGEDAHGPWLVSPGLEDF